MGIADTKVQFNMKKVEKHGKYTIHACNVTLPGGGKINCQDDEDEKKEFVGDDKYLRYTGNLKFFCPKKQFGIVTIDDGFDYQGHDVPNEIKVETSEVVAVDGRAGRMADLEVEFGIFKAKNERYKAYNLTLPGGDPLPAGESRFHDEQ